MTASTYNSSSVIGSTKNSDLAYYGFGREAVFLDQTEAIANSNQHQLCHNIVEL